MIPEKEVVTVGIEQHMPANKSREKTLIIVSDFSVASMCSLFRLINRMKWQLAATRRCDTDWRRFCLFDDLGLLPS
jgi:hypothetical protein